MNGNQRFEIGFSYFCGNCEEELNSMPWGFRLASGRPLCLRCTHIGVEEGWGRSCGLEASRAPKESRGIVLIVVLMAISALVFFVASSFMPATRMPR